LDLGKREQGLASDMVFGRFVKVEAVTVTHYRGKVAPVYAVMRKVNPD
jgi:hypothetical protein